MIKPEIDELGFNSNHLGSYCLKHVTLPFQEDVVYKLFHNGGSEQWGAGVSKCKMCLRKFAFAHIHSLARSVVA